MFVDKVKVFISAGKGGDGAVSFRREKFIERGGPDGGDGGDGGDVIFIGSNRTNTLASFRYQKEVIAKNGSSGGKRQKHGKSAPNMKINVPVGTVVYKEGKIITDIIKPGQQEIIAKKRQRRIW